MPKQIFSPDGLTLWATAPDDTWLLRAESPEIDTWVEGCWSSRFKEPPEHHTARLIVRRRVGRVSTSDWWHNERGQALLLAPDFWRPVPDLASA